VIGIGIGIVVWEVRCPRSNGVSVGVGVGVGVHVGVGIDRIETETAYKTVTRTGESRTIKAFEASRLWLMIHGRGIVDSG
jgi:hypothetical protein